MAAKSDKMYKNGPRLGKDDKGEVAIETPPAEMPSQADKVQAGVDGMAINVRHSSDRMEAVYRHITERLQMHHKQEAEHGLGGDKAKIHMTHMEEVKAMHRRHESELKGLASRHEKNSGSDAGDKK